MPLTYEFVICECLLAPAGSDAQLSRSTGRDEFQMGECNEAIEETRWSDRGATRHIPSDCFAQTVEPSVAGAGAEITTMCGDKPMTIALIDGVANNTWRRATRAEMEDEASKCLNVERVSYADAGGDPQKFNSDINSFVAQGYDIIVAFTDFGDASIPAYRAATQARVTVVPYISSLSGEVGTDYAANPYQDQIYIGRQWAHWFGKNGIKGNVVFLGGTPGATSSQRFMDGFKAGVPSIPTSSYWRTITS